MNLPFLHLSDARIDFALHSYHFSQDGLCFDSQHNINSMGTEQATFLQEEHSSQLIFVLRRQLLGAKLRKVEAALEDKAALPDIDVLERGVCVC